ncbi:MAG: hypothetical protein ACI8RZ_006189 [Myxococcota bacterium]|jgi:hypothetical protein
MRRLGFRRASPRYWLCRRRHGLPQGSHLTVADGSDRDLVELTSLQVTFEAEDERVHVYYREETPAVWGPEGHTPSDDLIRLGVDRAALRQTADAIARQLVAALSAKWMEDAAVRAGYRG